MCVCVRVCVCVSVCVDAFVNERRTENGTLYHYLTWTSISFNPLQDCGAPAVLASTVSDHSWTGLTDELVSDREGDHKGCCATVTDLPGLNFEERAPIGCTVANR